MAERCPFIQCSTKTLVCLEALKVDSPWFVLLEWKTYYKVRGFYLPKVIIFFIWRQGTLVNLHHWHAWDEVPGVDQLYKFPSRQMSQRTPSTTGPGHTTRHKKMQQNDARNWRKMVNESNCTFVLFGSFKVSYVSFHGKRNDKPGYNSDPVADLAGLHSFSPVSWKFAPTGHRSWYPDLIGLYIDMFW